MNESEVRGKKTQKEKYYMCILLLKGIFHPRRHENKLQFTEQEKYCAEIAPLVVIVLTSLTGNSISTNKRWCCWPRPWSILNHLYGFPLVGLYDSNAHIFMVIKVNDCCVPHLPRLYQYQFSTMKLPRSRGSSVTNRIKKGSVIPWHI